MLKLNCWRLFLYNFGLDTCLALVTLLIQVNYRGMAPELKPKFSCAYTRLHHVENFSQEGGGLQPLSPKFCSIYQMKNGIHSVKRAEVPKIRAFLLIIAWVELGKASRFETVYIVDVFHSKLFKAILN